MARKQPRRVERPTSLPPEVEEKPARPANPKAEANAKVITVATKRWQRADLADKDNRMAAYADLDFLFVEGAQWPEDAKLARAGRPCLEFNRLPTTIAQITGDIRQMRPAVKVVPVDSRGDVKTADVIAGMVRYVENRSDAPAAYFTGADQQVAAGIGHWRVETEYGSDSTFEQEIRISAIPDGIAVRWDPDAKNPTREDARFCFVPVDMSRDVFEETYPDATAAEMGDAELTQSGLSEWATADTVRVAEYWTKSPIKKTLALMPDGEILDLTDTADEDHEEKLARAEAAGARIEKRDGHKIERYLITANEVLEGPTPWPGRFIPIVPVVGIEMQVGRRRIRRGVVRTAKDAQRAYNYARSTQTEVVALQPKAPFIGTETQFKGYEAVWQTANTENHPFLPYNADPKAGTAMPQRVQPPVASAGLAELTREAAEDMKAVTGVYDASLGARSNETSGRAIRARQQEGDVGSFVYIVNFTRAVRHTGSIVVDLIPHIYDTERTLRIIGEDGKVDLVQINQAQGLATDDVAERIANDVTVGAYDVAMEMGPSYTTRREAALDGMIQLLGAAPEVAPLVLDLLAQAQDWPLADKIAKRIRTMLPPQIQAEEAQEEGRPPPPPPPPSPEQQAAAAAEQHKQQLEAGRQQLDLAKLDVERQRIQAEMAKVQAEIDRAAAEAQARVTGPAQPGQPDTRLEDIAQAVQHLSQIVATILEELPPADGTPSPENGPPGLETAEPGAMPVDLSGAPQGALSLTRAQWACPAPR
ncbi:portal protein [Methylobacterium komagatae]|uniref:Portal protein n=1 Tax=Methylobacterium komagatae TaxID=374425 RepID=A0ABW2BMF0_9HYPH